MPTVEGLEFAYALYPLPPGRLPFRRWRWELWHGANLVAAGWRLARPDAGRALRVHAAEFGHRLFGLPVPARDPRAGRGDLLARHAGAARHRRDQLHARPARARAQPRRSSSPRGSRMIDLRSDTVTRPTAGDARGDRRRAEVGDDQYGEDPSVIALQERVAALLGKEAALLVPTGTMANQLALKLYCRPGDDVIVGVESHAVWHETGAAAAIGGVQFTEVGTDGRFTADEFLAARNPRDHLLYPPTTLVEVEDTQNRKGGLVWDRAELERIGAAAREHGVASYLDGARLLNAAAARGDDPAALAAPFDLVSIALSKGLGCPVGSVLAGTAARHRRARPLPPDARRRDAPGRRARRRRASTRSTTTSSGSPTTTRTPA